MQSLKRGPKNFDQRGDPGSARPPHILTSSRKNLQAMTFQSAAPGRFCRFDSHLLTTVPEIQGRGKPAVGVHGREEGSGFSLVANLRVQPRVKELMTRRKTHNIRKILCLDMARPEGSAGWWPTFHAGGNLPEPAGTSQDKVFN
jgi:hypothetical protein